MELNRSEILEIIKAFDESGLDELQLEMEGLRIALGKGVGSSEEGLHKTLPRSKCETAARQEQEDGDNSPVPYDGEPQQIDAGITSNSAKEGLLPVKAPLLGIFYRAPKPGAPPFVSVGTDVTEDTTLCLIEVMKLFTAVKAGIKGRVVEICAEEGQLVEYQQDLFLIDPLVGSEDSLEGCKANSES